jgi:single-stranded DNA-binding protein
MRTNTNSTRNTSSKSTSNQQQQKSFSNNLVILTGNLGKDAAFFGANDSAASFRMATKSKFGEKEYVEWHPVVAFKELAKEVVEKCIKGRFIRVYGYLHHSNGGNDGGQYKTEVVATRIKYLERKK